MDSVRILKTEISLTKIDEVSEVLIKDSKICDIFTTKELLGIFEVHLI